jgi:uncharacterized membrane protein YfcA
MTFLLLASLVFFFGGFVKGVCGIGLPAVGISLLTSLSLVDPRTALAVTALPVFTTNLIQCKGTGSLLPRMRRFYPLIFAMTACTFLGAYVAAGISRHLLLGIIGVIVVMFSLSSFLRFITFIPAAKEQWAGPLAGAIAGVMSGLSTVPGPPVMMYLLALGLSKNELIGSLALILLCGSIPLILSYVTNGIIGLQEAIWSSLAIIPTVMGLWFGQKVRGLLNEQLFRSIVLGVLALLGMNMIRRTFL